MSTDNEKDAPMDAAAATPQQPVVPAPQSIPPRGSASSRRGKPSPGGGGR